MRSIACACFALALALALAAVSAQVTPPTPPAASTPAPAPAPAPTQPQQPLSSATPAAPAPATPTAPLPPTPLPPTTPGPVDTSVAAPAPVAPTPAPAQTPAPAKPLTDEKNQTQPRLVPADELDEHERMFYAWMQQNKKTYKPENVWSRYMTWRQNLNKVIAHNNAGTHSYTLRMTPFADLTEKEFTELRQGCFLAHGAPFEEAEREIAIDDHPLPPPEKWDWRPRGAVNRVVHEEGNCGACYAFSAAGALEGAMAVAGSELVPLSAQQIVDCSKVHANYGCKHGVMANAFSYIKRYGGLCSERDYPYIGREGRCRTCPEVHGTKISGYTKFRNDQENKGLWHSVAQRPVAVALATANTAWQLYGGGVMDVECGQDLNHAALAVGYDTTENGVDYWIIKNSWSDRWGENGYIRLKRGVNMCGIANMASFPNVVTQQPEQQQQQQQK